MTNQNTPRKAQPGAPERRSTSCSEATRTRKVSEVFRILEPSPMKPMATVPVPVGLWRTGWLPKPQGAVS